MNPSPRFLMFDSDPQTKVWRVLRLMFLLLALPLEALGQPSYPYIEMPPQNLTVGLGAPAVFSVTAGGASPLAYQWYFLNGVIGTNVSGATTAMLTITNAQLSQSGLYLVVVSNVYGAITNSPVRLTVTNLLTVQFTASPAQGGAPLAVRFTSPGSDSAGNGIASWIWNFGDGATSTAQNPSHTYETSGNFQPSLIVTNSHGAEIIASGPSVTVASYLGLVLNGGFETGDFSGWTLTDSGIYGYDLVDTFFQSVPEGMEPHAGSYFARLGQSGSLGYLSQTLATTAGAHYLLSFWLNSPDGQTPNSFLASWNGNTLFSRSNVPAFGSNGPALAWTNLQFLVSATASATALQFGFRDDPTALGLDDVSVLLAQPGLLGLSVSGANLVASGTNGLAGQTYRLLASTNLSLPLSQWSPVATNILGASGNFTLTATNAVNPNHPSTFYVVRLE